MIIFFAVLAVLAVIGYWMKKRNPGKTDDEKSPDEVLENAANLADRFNRVRYMDQDGK